MVVWLLIPNNFFFKDGWPPTQYGDKDVLEFLISCLYLLSTGITGVPSWLVYAGNQT